jgi:hypothetical protein
MSSTALIKMDPGIVVVFCTVFIPAVVKSDLGWDIFGVVALGLDVSEAEKRCGELCCPTVLSMA